jgi:hypothetical protein
MEPRLIERERTVLRDLINLAAERSHAEQEAEDRFRSRNESAEKQYEVVRQRLLADYHNEQSALSAEFERVRSSIVGRYQSESRAAERQRARSRRRATERFKAAWFKADADFKEARWTADTLYQGTKAKTRERFQELQRQIARHHREADAIRLEAEELLGTWLRPRPSNPSATAPGAEDASQRLATVVATADEHLQQARKLFLPKLLRGGRFVGVLVVLWLVCLVPAFWAPDWRYWLAGATAAAVIGGTALYIWFTRLARSRVARAYEPLGATLDEAAALVVQGRQQIAEAFERQRRRDRDQFQTERRRAEDQYRQLRTQLKERRAADIDQAEKEFARQMAEVKGRHNSASGQAEEKYPRLLTESKERYEYDSYQVHDRYYRQLDESRGEHEADWHALATAWHEGLARARAEIDTITSSIQRRFPAWDDPSWAAWQPPADFPPAIRFGDFTVDLAHLPHGLSQDPRLAPEGTTRFVLPALVPFPEPCSMLFLIGDGGREAAEQSLQAVMFRLLTAVPPAKVRFTIIDPVGLGRSFAAFMHLADHVEALVSSRIWTEQAHIDQRLSDLTAHMETVIQKFLRNQFATVAEYNAHAGEVAEPYRVLVVANFPVNFSAEAARRLVSIAQSGARCGVSTLITVDPSQPLPPGFSIEELRQPGVHLVWQNGRYAWEDEDFGRYPFRLDGPPSADLMTRTLQEVGRRAKQASRVEVPFEFIVAPAERWWAADSRSGIDVPLGRAGATKRQHLRLGQGTAQHVLIAGKTGSGKSTLLHALITNLSLLYSPREVELYLVDFKEGVEFKPYAAQELPHARLVAIESEREFGLSVLQRLEAELRQRGDLFRAKGVQDLAGYRQADGDMVLPRILLIVDEFQMFFVEDDKIAQDAALLLDRLVRQGRAFGIHVLLGSQTLGGAYSLARSTIGQMAVRIALQCSEADAHLILSDDNPAARLLSRPGEAIYNDANGLVEGNDFFQVVWLSDELKEDYLRRVHQLARQRHLLPAQPQIVFEGKAPADVAKNHLLSELIQATGWPEPPRATPTWLGEAMAIKDPTAAVFRPQSGSNLLIVGQADEAALAIMTTALVSAAAQHAPEPPGGPRVYVLDGSPVDGPTAGYWGRVAAALPHPVRVGGWREVPAIIAEVAGEVERRQQHPEGPMSPWFLFVYSLQRFRDIRPAEDDFGSFSRREEEAPNPGKLFKTVLRDGAAVGVYLVVWCDTMNNVTRSLERSGLREFEMRVLFQMSGSDSSNLIDSPAASRLGMHRAIFYSEDRGQPEKFRPYGLPPQAWLDRMAERLKNKAASLVGGVPEA